MFKMLWHEMRRFITILRHGRRHHILASMLTKYFLFSLSKVFPKKSTLWLGAWLSQSAADNVYYLFEYIIANHPEIQIIWVTKNKEVYRQLCANNKPIVYAYSLCAIWFLLRAKVYLLSHGAQEMAWFGVSEKTFCMQLWHGSPLKKIGCDDPLLRENASKGEVGGVGYKHHIYLHPYDVQYYNAVATPSIDFKKIFQSAFRLQCYHFPVLGNPRIDYLLSNTQPYHAHAPNILYAPTFRSRDGIKCALDSKNITPNSTQYESLNRLFSQYHANMAVQFHPADTASTSLQNLECIQQISRHKDFYAYFGRVDILITDYSSLIFEFLLTKKPVICMIADIDSYVAEHRELYRHPAEIPGVYICYSWDEVYVTLENIFRNGIDPEKIPAEKVLKKEIYAFQDCNAAKRTVKYLKRASRITRFVRTSLSSSMCS